jgi:hypothetical protein
MHDRGGRLTCGARCRRFVSCFSFAMWLPLLFPVDSAFCPVDATHWGRETQQDAKTNRHSISAEATNTPRNRSMANGADSELHTSTNDVMIPLQSSSVNSRCKLARRDVTSTGKEPRINHEQEIKRQRKTTNSEEQTQALKRMMYHASYEKAFTV